MNNEEKKQKLAQMQKYFFISFLISFVLLLIASFMCIVMHDTQVAFVTKYFPLDDIRDYNFLVILLLGIWKILIFQFTLIPALAIWGIRKCDCEACKR